MVPWWLPDSDLREANGGEPELERSTVREGTPEKHFGLNVWGQADDPPCLGVIAIRCERAGATVVPLQMCIADTTPIKVEHKPAMNLSLLSNPRRVTDDGES